MLHLLLNTRMYSQQNWQSMQSAYDKALVILSVHPMTDHDKERLARNIMRMVDSGARDEDLIVAKAVERERLVLDLAKERTEGSRCEARS